MQAGVAVGTHTDMSDTSDTVRTHVYVSGRVQGVFFRGTVSDKATEHGLAGYVRNLSDGRVEAEFQGPEEDVQALVDFCRQGPDAASVNEVEAESMDPDPSASGFSVG